MLPVNRSAAPALLRTKLHRPHIADELVPRLDLLERLEQGRERGRPLTLVSAPAGYGKTALVSTWLEGCGLPCAWLSLDEQDGDPALFLSYVLAALQTLFPDVGSETQALLAGVLLVSGVIIWFGMRKPSQ